MSGLEKFQQSDSWRMNFKKLLFTPRTPIVVEPLKEADRFSLDVVDLEVLIDKKKVTTNIEMDINTENKENSDFNVSDCKIAHNITVDYEDHGEPHILKILKTTEGRSVDDSFETLEQMCNKTASDPNSTLFKYLNSDSKEDVLADAKRRENKKDFNKCSHKKSDGIPEFDNTLNNVEETQLEDIEAPSQLWENTISSEKILEASPVKMIGLLRPSTILEENNEEANSLCGSTETSYYTAIKNSEYEFSTTFETATDTNRIHNSSCDEEITKLIKEDKSFQALNESHKSIKTNVESRTFDNTASVIEILSDEEATYSECSNKISKNDSLIVEDVDEHKFEKSLQLNDTMEEVEFMLQKRIEYMGISTNSNDNVKHFTVSQAKRNSVTHPSHNTKQCTNTCEPKPRIPNKTDNLCETNLGLDIKPIPKLNLFKHPVSSGIPKGRSKEAVSKQFAHVISPIGAYMKNTAVTPLMSTMRTHKQKNDLINTTAFRELEVESRLYQNRFGLVSTNTGSGLPGIPSGAKTLPKKAYISSNIKQVKDERTTLMIPGGKKIQKYLEPAMLPAVVRHEGKIKVTGDFNGQDHKTINTPTLSNNASLADLSLASGDVSLYTIMDARKF